MRATQTLARREYKTGRSLGETDRGSWVPFVPPRRPVSNIYKTELVPLKKKEIKGHLPNLASTTPTHALGLERKEEEKDAMESVSSFSSFHDVIY